MDASVSGRLAAFLCLLAAAITAPVVIAQPAPGVVLRYEAFAGCPDRDAFAKNLEARRRGAAADKGAVQLDVRLSSSAELPNRVEGSIVVSSANGVGSARRIVAATCAEAADALALIAALALQGIEVEEVPAPAPVNGTDEPSPGKRKDPSDTRGVGRADRPRASDPVPTTTQTEPATVATADEAAAVTQPATETSTEGEVTDESAAETRESASEADPTEPDAEHTTRVYVLLSGGAASGILPRVQPFPELALGLERGPRGGLFWSVHAAFRISPDQTRHFDEGVVTFGWWTGLSAACLGVRDSELSASGCATLEVGVLSSGASDTENPRDERRAWVAVGPGLTFGYDMTPALRLSLRAEVLTPITRYSLELPRGAAVHEPSALGLRAGLGVGLWL
jgi:hypothetical protein